MRSQGNSCVALGIRLFLAALAPGDREGPGFPGAQSPRPPRAELDEVTYEHPPGP